MFFFLIIFGLLTCTLSQIPHQYHIISIGKNWTEAQSYCRAMYTDLATVDNTDEMNSLFKSISDVSQDMYIGLYRGQVFKWHWSLTDSSYKNWKPGISDGNQETCAVMDGNNGKWFIDKCESKRPFVCFNATASKKFILITDNKPWTDAQEYCRTFHTDLANPKDSSENQDVKNTAKTNVWIGLFKDSWTWSDQSSISFRFWSSSLSSSQDCASIMVNQTGRWNEVQCSVPLYFICYGDLKSQPTTKPVTQPAATQNHNNTSSAPSYNLILVNEKMTWLEAVSYCRKHHVDLVSIHSQELQDRTAQKATQASTSHVWLGLRYTCKFNFWFWIKNTETGCYQNWAPGHGPYGYEECELSGAMESTGGHQWVGRPGSDRLNFICYNCVNCQLCNDVF
ncbi:macrophage mannose receptor 1 isoform X2 [Misgurnus anguillicaudatus]|uniref:macrophage mannose receptor 1 isoform X2 n=1 Tax=Misgurnus anguillicaudatus TaxID=75329 RepID=UPI0024355DA3|nr:macrophage mannose receptor 1 isoform X2 [Misgurnus anguillicaudatus]